MKLGNFQDVMKNVKVNNGCFEWQRARSKAGYGQFWNGEKKIYSHRFVATLFYGEPKDKEQVLHSCDNKPCCNPDHLRWGTALENNREARQRIKFKTNYLYGEKHHRAKLNQQQVNAIRKRRNAGEIYRTIAEDYKVELTTIYYICANKNWSKSA